MQVRAGAPSVGVVVVTYNRHELLRECLDRLAAQSVAPDVVLVVDNASTDDTADLLSRRSDVTTIRLEDNIGGSGGFRLGLEAAVLDGCEWVWLMDDDTFVEPDALERLLEARSSLERSGAPSPSVLASRVDWTDGSLHPMNKPWFDPRADRTAQVEAAELGVMPMRAASFVSVLINSDAVRRHGLPHADYFIYNDDLEFTARLLRDGAGFWVPSSRALHQTSRPRMPYEAGDERFYFDIRNRVHMLRGSSWTLREKATLIRHLQNNVRRYLRANDRSAASLRVVMRGLRDGARFDVGSSSLDQDVPRGNNWRRS